MKKLVIIDDVNTKDNDSIDRFRTLASEFGYETVVVKDKCSDSMEEFSENFLKLETEGSGALP